MMKTFFSGLFLLVIAGLWTGCSNDEAADSSGEKQAISFRMQGSTPTPRATGTTAPYVDAFVVYGTDNVSTTTNIFNGVTVARQVGGTFDYNPKKYYSLGAASANFVAYSPVSATANISASVTAAPLTTASFTYEVVAPDASGNTTQEDLLVAGRGVATATASIPLAFQHALSRIFVKATNALTETVIIKGLTLKNLKSKGTLTGTPPVTPPNAWTWAWKNPTAPISYGYILAPTGVAVKAGVNTATLVTSMEQGMMVLPQKTVNLAKDQSNGDFALEVTYDVANLTNQKAYIYLQNDYSFDMGMQYAITIAFNGTVTNLIEINFTISVTAFEAISDATPAS